jgi:hypothetical protein
LYQGSTDGARAYHQADEGRGGGSRKGGVVSIYCSLLGFPQERELGPLKYQGSHVLPNDKDKRAGDFGIAAIPRFITRDGRDNKPEDDMWHPWLRVHIFDGHQGSVILTRKQVERLRDALNNWLERTPPPRSRRKASAEAAPKESGDGAKV